MAIFEDYDTYALSRLKFLVDSWQHTHMSVILEYLVHEDTKTCCSSCFGYHLMEAFCLLLSGGKMAQLPNFVQYFDERMNINIVDFQNIQNINL